MMAKGLVSVYIGDGNGESPAALGRAVQTAMEGRRAVVIRFLRGKGLGDSGFLRRMEPELKIFHFEKSDEKYEELTEEKKQEEIINIRNGINYAKKVLTTGECDLLILDEVLGLVEKGIVSAEDVKNLVDCRAETGVILTGVGPDRGMCAVADEVVRIQIASR